MVGTLPGVWDARPARSCPEGLGELAARPLICPARRHCRLPPVRKDSSTRGLSPGINPDSHPWADAADRGPEAR